MHNKFFFNNLFMCITFMRLSHWSKGVIILLSFLNYISLLKNMFKVLMDFVPKHPL